MLSSNTKLNRDISKGVSYMMEPDQNVIIRAAHRSDTFGWLLMRQKLWPDCAPSTHKIEIQKVLNDPENFQGFVAEQNEGNLIGFLEASIRQGDSESHLQIQAWFVETFFRKQNTGKHLLQEAEVWGKTKGVKETLSEAKLEDANSQLVHKNLGFTEIHRNEKYILYRKT